MPRKIRELIADLERAGFRLRKNKRGGSHRRYQHPKGPQVTLSGNRGDDAHHYQEKEVKQAIEEAL
ncbi:MAG: type II toxin-antitoxin system HicA family toxin [Gemmatimonadota bacterium]|nr:type II toxin-antitoxin system HicA family toxin [Gemmatimonadota bacterium]